MSALSLRIDIALGQVLVLSDAGPELEVAQALIAAQEGIEAMCSRLEQAEQLLERGVATINRQGWEPGETDSEWCQAALTFLSMIEAERGMESTA